MYTKGYVAVGDRPVLIAIYVSLRLASVRGDKEHDAATAARHFYVHRHLLNVEISGEFFPSTSSRTLLS